LTSAADYLLSKVYDDKTPSERNIYKEHVEFGLNVFETMILMWEIRMSDNRKKCELEDVELQELFDENPVQTLLSKMLNVTPMVI